MRSPLCSPCIAPTSTHLHSPLHSSSSTYVRPLSAPTHPLLPALYLFPSLHSLLTQHSQLPLPCTPVQQSAQSPPLLASHIQLPLPCTPVQQSAQSPHPLASHLPTIACTSLYFPKTLASRTNAHTFSSTLIFPCKQLLLQHIHTCTHTLACTLSHACMRTRTYTCTHTAHEHLHACQEVPLSPSSLAHSSRKHLRSHVVLSHVVTCCAVTCCAVTCWHLRSHVVRLPGCASTAPALVLVPECRCSRRTQATTRRKCASSCRWGQEFGGTGRRARLLIEQSWLAACRGKVLVSGGSWLDSFTSGNAAWAPQEVGECVKHVPQFRGCARLCVKHVPQFRGCVRLCVCLPCNGSMRCGGMRVCLHAMGGRCREGLGRARGCVLGQQQRVQGGHW